MYELVSIYLGEFEIYNLFDNLELYVSGNRNNQYSTYKE